MSNTIAEGMERELPPDRQGEIFRGPTPAIVDLKTEILQASAFKEAGQGDSVRERSSIESRTDLRLAATNEAMRADPARSTVTVAIEQDTARLWADLDATDFGRTRSDRRREAALEAIAGHVRVSPEYAEELKKRSPVLAESAKVLNDERQKVERDIALRMIENNAEALSSRAGAQGPSEPEQREMAKQDAKSLSVIPAGGQQNLAAAVVGENARNHPAYRDELQKVAPQLAREASSAVAERDSPTFEEHRHGGLVVAPRDLVNVAGGRESGAAATGNMPIAAERHKPYADTLAKEAPAIASEVDARREREAADKSAAEQRSDVIRAAAQSRAALIDAAALAAVANVRTRETAKVVELLASSPGTTTQQLRAAQTYLKAPALDGRVAAPNDPDVTVEPGRAVKRPVAEEDLTQALLARFIVSHEKRGLLDKGTTEFTFRSGVEQGRVAFIDAGKALSTDRDDKATIRAMVEVAAAKNWTEITVSGTDDFRRNAWLEANLNGIKVRGYEPRDADKQLLTELQQRSKPANVITTAEPEQRRDKPQEPVRPAEPATQRKHIDGDALTAQEKSVLDSSRTILDSKALGEKFTEAALKELEAKLRGERVYVGEVVDHGRAPYQFNKDKDESYYVTLKTRAGEQVIWGKGLEDAMKDRRPGEQIVLQNDGKRDVTVQERVQDDHGHVIGTRMKASKLNSWKSELLSRFSEKARATFSDRSTARQPSLGVYDAKAPRAPAKPAGPARTPDQQRNAEHQRNSRER